MSYANRSCDGVIIDVNSNDSDFYKYVTRSKISHRTTLLLMLYVQNAPSHLL